MDKGADPVRSGVCQMKNDAGQRDGRQAEQWRQAEETPHSRSRPPFPAPVAHLLTNLFIALDLEDNTFLTRRRARILRLSNSAQVVARGRRIQGRDGGQSRGRDAESRIAYHQYENR